MPTSTVTSPAAKRHGRTSPEETLALWRRYHSSGDRALRDRLVLTFAPLVKYIVYKKAREIPHHCEVEDFISAGLEALIKAIDRYDPERGATLEQFAWTRIHGAVLDELRRHDWAPRSLRRWEREINQGRQRFVSLNNRQPTIEELADAVDTTPAALRTRLGEIANAEVGSLNTTAAGDEGSSIEHIDMIQSADPAYDPEHQLSRRDARAHFRAAFARLPERERQIAVMLYVNNMTLQEIGNVLGVSESRICQIHGQLKRRLREMLSANVELYSELV